jgi:hypothetical protein
MSAAEKAYKDGFYAQAEQLYAEQLAQHPDDPAASARLIETLLHENKLAQASEQVKTVMEAHPQSAEILTAQAEVQLREGQPWLAMKTLDAAAAFDGCYARVHLVRSQIFHIDSMYASERAELQKGYEIGVTDPDILMAWSRMMPAAQEIEGTEQALGTMKDVDPETRAKAQATAHRLRSLLHEDTQTCKVLPTDQAASLPLQASRADGQHIDSYRLEVMFPKGPARLTLDTATSGLFISKAIADANGFQRAMGAPMGTVQADVVRIGPLEFHDCMVGVSELPFPGKADGMIGTDLLASYLITIDPFHSKLNLDPLPPQPGILPGDRARSGELAVYEPVYHRRQYLLVPVTIQNKARRLFALDTGMRITAMDSQTAHAVSDTRVGFTSPLPTKSGTLAQVYRDSFDLQFAGLEQTMPSGSVLEYNPAAISQNSGFGVAGLLGFDVLGRMILHLDYRDGLVKLESTNGAAVASKASGSKAAPGAEETADCPRMESNEIPLNQTLQLRVTGTIDSAHLKPGKEIFAQVVHGVVYPDCTLDTNSMVYGHVTAVSSLRNPDAAELAIVFDRGDCERQPKKPLPLYVIGLIGPPDQKPDSLHGAMPTEVHGARSISETAALTNGYDDQLGGNGKAPRLRPGAVIGVRGMRLDPVGGPACSARFSQPARSIQLGTDSHLILELAAPAAGGSH